jgi:hypothetical protein
MEKVTDHVHTLWRLWEGDKSDMVVVSGVCSSSFFCQTALDQAFSGSMLFPFIIVVAEIWFLARSLASLGIFYYSFCSSRKRERFMHACK